MLTDPVNVMVPADIVVSPVKELVPDNVKVPAPVFIILPVEIAIGSLMVLVPTDSIVKLYVPVIALPVDGFRQHSAEEKGFIWFDTVSAKKIYVIRAFFYNDDKYIRDGMFLIFTKDFIGNEIPKEFYVDFNNWKDSNKLSKKILEKFIN